MKPNKNTNLRKYISNTIIVAMCFASLLTVFNRKVYASSSESLLLDSQTSFLSPGETFNISFQLSNGLSLIGNNLNVIIFHRLSSRSAYDQSINNPQLPLASTGSFSVTSSIETSNKVSISLSLLEFGTASTQPGFKSLNLGCSTGSCSGVYPMEVQLIPPNTEQVLSTLITHVVIVPNAPPATKLQLGLTVPVAYPTSSTLVSPLGPTTTNFINQVSNIENVIISNPSANLTLQISPYGLSLLASTPRGQSLLSSLKVITHRTNIETLSNTYSDISSQSLMSAGLGEEILNQISYGDLELKHSLNLNALSKTYVANSFDTSQSLGYLSTLGFNKFILDPNAVKPSTLRYTATQPFQLDGLANSSLGITDDAALLNDLDGTDQMLAAETFVGEVSQVFFDDPNEASLRSLVVAIPTFNNVAGSTLGDILSALNASPIISTVTLSKAFDAPIGILSNPSKRAFNQTSKSSTLNAKQIDSFLQDLDSLSSMGINNAYISKSNLTIRDAIFVLESNISRSESFYSSVAQTILNSIKNYASSISMPKSQTITLTSQSGKIPLSILYSNSSVPIKVKLILNSSGLRFINGNTQYLTLNKNLNTTYFTVSARSHGTVPLTVTIYSSDGNLKLFTIRYYVNSSAISWIGVVLSLGAALLLLWWWIKNFRKKNFSKGKHSVKKSEFKEVQN